jgi:predicted NAD-dependent protein-ADP-ribosyltransferase YbiA (DUF1768 family)
MVVSLIDPTIEYEDKREIEKIDKNTKAEIYETDINDKTIQFVVGKIIKKYIDKNIIYYPIYLIKNSKVDSQIGLYEKKYKKGDDEEFNIDEFDEPLFFVVFEKVKQFVVEQKVVEQPVENTQKNKKRERKRWIQTFMKDDHFDIVDTKGDGNCMFTAIEKGLSSVGRFITVSDMRDILVKNVTTVLFNTYKILHDDAEKQYKNVSDNTKSLKKSFDDIKKKTKNTKDHSETKKLVKEADDISKKHTREKRELEFAKEYNEEFLFMKGIDSEEKFKSLIKTNAFWGDTWALSTLEREMNIKLMLFSEESYLSGDYENVFKCGQLNDDMKLFEPEYYIMVGYTGNHYQLITYDDVGAFKFKDLMDSVKDLVVNKCLERNEGPYYIIPDFKMLKGGSKKNSNTDKDKELHSDIYKGLTVFQIYEYASDFDAPGKGNGERLDKSEVDNYKDLRHDTSWRRILSNEWLCEFTLDGHKWNSVEHYCLASLFKKTDPEYYLKFSLDSVSKENRKKKQIATNIDYARKAVSVYEKEKEDELKQPSSKSMEDAIRAKFMQNEDLKEILSHTKNAKLVYFVPKSSPIPATLLMKIRKTLL